jgi:polysaccharide deacetylase 2 family uncharacterized protein YibQ
LTDTLSASGFTQSDISAQSRKEQKSGAYIWIEYFKEIRYPANIKIEVVADKIREIAQKHKCAFVLTNNGSGKAVIELRYGKRLFSKIVFDAAAAQPVATAKKRIAVVIDDVGYKDNLGPFLDLGIPLTFAILPYERYSKIVAAELTKKGMPYILHLPLEPLGYPKVDPGKAALLVNMTDKEIKKKFLSDLASVPGVSGVNNHMGSRFSEDQGKMRVLLELVKSKGLFYFDSYTSTATKAGKAAAEVSLPFAQNTLFVDLQDNPGFMKKQFSIAIKKINKYGQCAVIGHIHKKFMPQALKDAISMMKDNNIEFVYLADLVKIPGKNR